jgi:hypothetical protein
VVLLACGAATAFAQSQWTQIEIGTTFPEQTAPDYEPPAPGAVTFYTDEAAFLADCVNPIKTDPFGFAAGQLLACPNWLHCEQDDSCVNPGDANCGYQLGGLPYGFYVLVGAGVIGNAADNVGPNYFIDDLYIEFDPTTDCVGFDLYAVVGPVNCTMSVWDSPTNVVGTTNVSGTSGGQFFGVISDSKDIFRVVCTGATTSDAELIGELQYGSHLADGGAPDDGGVPATTGIGIALLVVLLGGGSAYFLRRK